MTYLTKDEHPTTGRQPRLAMVSAQRQVCRYPWLILVAALVSACGAGTEILAVLPYVTPLGGVWVWTPDDPNLSPETLQFSVPVETEVFASKYDLDVTLVQTAGICGGATGDQIPGTLDNGKLVLRQRGAAGTTSCLEGRFTDLVTLELMDTATGNTRVYRNDRVDVNLNIGLWVSEGDGQLKLKFDELQSGEPFVLNGGTANVLVCDVSSAGSTINLQGELLGFNTTTPRSNPSILSVPSGPSPPNPSPRFTQVVFVDGASLSLLNSAGQSVNLRRKVDTTTNCP